tara:strand:- start:5126 stop:5659 length:534 start_codon:yes stop_codon:yes gene_type:complete
MIGAFGKAAQHFAGTPARLKGMGRGIDTMQSFLTGIKGKDMLKGENIGMTIPAAGFGYLFGKELIYDPMKEAINKDPMAARLMASQEAERRRKEMLQKRLEIEDLQKRAMQASMRLAALDPHLYNEVMAGRSLPKDAVVFGGQPRQDLMEQLSMAMAQGQFKEDPSAQDELMQELGV